MNEHFQRLILTAQQAAAKETQTNSFAYESLVYTKFAEMIVRECASVSENHRGINDKYFIADAIKEHFGVE